MTARDRKLRARRRNFRRRTVEKLEEIIQHAAENIQKPYLDETSWLFHDAITYREHWEIEYEAACVVLAEKLQST